MDNWEIRENVKFKPVNIFEALTTVLTYFQSIWFFFLKGDPQILSFNADKSVPTSDVFLLLFTLTVMTSRPWRLKDTTTRVVVWETRSQLKLCGIFQPQDHPGTKDTQTLLLELKTNRGHFHYDLKL